MDAGTKVIIFSGLYSNIANIENDINSALAKESKNGWEYLDMKVVQTGEGRIAEVVLILDKEKKISN